MPKFSLESVQSQLEALGIPDQGELEEITNRLNGYIDHLEALRHIPLDGIYPLDSPPVCGDSHD